MASLANAIQFSIQRSQFSSGNKSFGTRTSSSGLLPCKIQSVSSSLGFSPESFSPVGFSGKALKFSGWDHLLRRRGAVDFPNVALLIFRLLKLQLQMLVIMRLKVLTVKKLDFEA